jgi:hypothetical protein
MLPFGLARCVSALVEHASIEVRARLAYLAPPLEDGDEGICHDVVSRRGVPQEQVSATDLAVDLGGVKVSEFAIGS